jgi:hypothetical protein
MDAFVANTLRGCVGVDPRVLAMTPPGPRRQGLALDDPDFVPLIKVGRRAGGADGPRASRRGRGCIQGLLPRARRMLRPASEVEAGAGTGTAPLVPCLAVRPMCVRAQQEEQRAGVFGVRRPHARQEVGPCCEGRYP